MLKQRNVTLDVAKGFILLTLPIIHSVLFYCSTSVQYTTGGQILAFIAELAAPVFMVTMGIAITYGQRKTTRQILLRSLKLLLLGYILNAMKFAIPEVLLGLPENLFIENGISNDLNGLFRLIMIGDILQLAAISYAICGFLFRIRRYERWAVLFAVTVVLCSPITWNIKAADFIPHHLVTLLTGIPPERFFPVFPWITYSITGLSIGFMIKNYTARESYLRILLLGLVICVSGLIGVHYEPMEWRINFYRLGPAATSIHLGTALLFIAICHFITKALLSTNILNFLTMLSKQVTFVYMTQWVLVCWLLPVFGYRTKTLESAFAPLLIVTLTTLFLTYLYAKMQFKVSRPQHNNNSNIK